MTVIDNKISNTDGTALMAVCNKIVTSIGYCGAEEVRLICHYVKGQLKPNLKTCKLYFVQLQPFLVVILQFTCQLDVPIIVQSPSRHGGLYTWDIGQPYIFGQPCGRHKEEEEGVGVKGKG